LGVNGGIGESTFDRLGDAEVDYLGYGDAVAEGHQHVRRFNIAVDDALLMGVLDGLADLDEEVDAFAGAEVILVAEVGNPNASDQFHDKVGTTGGSGSGIEDPGDAGMIHHGEGLTLDLETGEQFPGIHAELDQFQGDLAPDRLGLFGNVDNTIAAFAEALPKFVGADHLADIVIIGFNGRDLHDRLGGIDEGGGRITEGVVSRDEFIEAFAEIWLAFTRGGEESRALGGRHGSCEMKEEFLVSHNGARWDGLLHTKC
jgi:hypothetical protein